jgi:putative ABC transport system permease protein
MLTDLRVTLRGLLAAPWFALTVVGTLALGIGASTAVFSVAYTMLWRPLPFADAGRVLMLAEFSAASESRLVAPVTFDDWRTRQTAFNEIAAFRYWETVNLEDQVADPEPVTLTTGTDNLFRALGVTPLIGRAYTEEQNPNGGSEAVLSYELWQRRYRGDPAVLGRVIRIRGTATTVVGVMPPLPRTVATGWGDVWTCLYRYNIAQQRATGYRARYLSVVGRLAPDVSVEQATTRMRALQRQLWTEPTSVAEGFDVWLTPLVDVALGGVRLPMLVVVVAAIALLIVACANVTTLMLVRTALRRRETATRLALGAAPARMFRLLAIEGAVLASVAGAVGLLLTGAGLAAMRQVGAALPRIEEVGMTWPTTAAALLISAGCAAVCAVMPLVEARRTRLSDVLGDAGRGGTGGVYSTRLRRVLVAAQVTAACVLLIGGSLLVRSLVNVLRVDPGFDAAPAVYFDLYLPNSRYPNDAAYTRFYRDLTRTLSESPDIEAVGALLYFPFKPKLWPVSVTVEGRAVEPGAEPVVFYNQVAGNYFRAMNIPLERGRWFTEREVWEGGAARVILINRTMARQLFGGDDPIGRRLGSGDSALEIIGVVGDVRQQRLDLAPSPEYYTTFREMPMPFQSMVVRGRDGRAPKVAQVRDAVHQIDPGLALANLMPLEHWVTEHTRERQFALSILTLFGVLALSLGTVGVFGAVSYAVAQRRREIGLRLALGASPRSVRRLVLRDGMWLMASGIAAGVVLTAMIAPIARELLYGVSTLDPLSYLGVPALLMLAGLAACWWPARTAARSPLAEVLRDV